MCGMAIENNNSLPPQNKAKNPTLTTMLTPEHPSSLNTMQTPQPSTLSLPKYLHEDGLTQECKDLIKILPIESGWIVNHIHQYQGFWHPPRQLQGVLTCQTHFQAQDTDILLVTTPKSGTTWLKAIMFAVVNRVRYPDHQNHTLLSSNPHDIVPFLELNIYVDNQVPDLTSLTSPRLFATHLSLVSMPQSVKDSACKFVYLCRNPKDTFVSLWHFTNKMRPKERGTNSLEEAIDKFCRGVNVCGPFWDHVLDYWKESLEMPQRVLFLKYEEMKKEPTTHLKRLAAFLECPFSLEEETNGVVENILKLCSFDNLSNLEVNLSGKWFSGEENKAFFWRGEVGDRRNHLTTEMVERLDHIIEDKLNGYGLKF